MPVPSQLRADGQPDGGVRDGEQREPEDRPSATFDLLTTHSGWRHGCHGRVHRRQERWSTRRFITGDRRAGATFQSKGMELLVFSATHCWLRGAMLTDHLAD